MDAATSPGRVGSVSPEERAYRAMTPVSARLHDEARGYLPGGDSRSPLYHAPYPATMAEGRGAHVVDVDGNELLDLTGNHTALLHGFGHPQVLAAVRDQVASGTCFPGPTRPQIRLARQLSERIPSMERIRFTNSGTEAVMLAARAARAHTGRGLIAKAEGGYHGTWDDVMVGTHPPMDRAGDAARPRPVASSAGLAPGVCDRVLVLPFGDVDAAAALLERHGREVAAVLVEPVQGSAGMIPAGADYLRMLREVTARHGILLIFDEVVSFRVALGGAQEHFGVSPDLTCLGKAIGGGFPLGALGGRADVMSAFDPSAPGGPRIPHPGSLNANPVGLVAGSVVLDLLTREAIARLDVLGAAARLRIHDALARASVPAQLTGLGSLFGIHLTDRPVRTYRDAVRSDRGRLHRLYLGLFAEGVLIDPRGVGCLSTAVAPPDLDTLADALARVTRRWTADFAPS
jgi:glutamate-1-semialdehyde 2,1-aminomutase